MDVDAKSEALVDGPFAELSTAMTALLGFGVSPPAQADSVPVSVSKMKMACIFVPGREMPTRDSR